MRPFIEEVATTEQNGSPSQDDQMDVDSDPSIAKVNGIHAGSEASRIKKTAQSDEPKTVFFSLSIPPSLVPPPMQPAQPRVQVAAPLCGVAGCEEKKKYRVVLEGGGENAACGLEHFRLLKAGGAVLAR